MISGDLSVGELPTAFNAAVKEFLDLEVPDDRRGCLQDIHWFAGAFGYFPTYLVGALAAAQLYEAASASISDLPAALKEGDFGPLVDWLRENIHSNGSLLDWEELIVAATGKPLGFDSFLRHLQQRYL